MAIGDGSFVTPNTIVGATLSGTPWLAQPPIIGITAGNSSPRAILWDNGIFDAAVPDASLLEITAASSQNIADFSGQIVRRTVDNQSGEYIGAVVFLGSIDFGQGAIAFAVVKSVGPGAFFWASALADLAVVAGR